MTFKKVRLIKVSIQNPEDHIPSVKFFDAKKATKFNNLPKKNRKDVASLIALNFEAYMKDHIYRPHVVVNILTPKKVNFKHLIFYHNTFQLKGKAFFITSVFLYDSMNNGQHLFSSYKRSATLLHNDLCNNIYL